MVVAIRGLAERAASATTEPVGARQAVAAGVAAAAFPPVRSGSALGPFTSGAECPDPAAGGLLIAARPLTYEGIA